MCVLHVFRKWKANFLEWEKGDKKRKNSILKSFDK